MVADHISVLAAGGPSAHSPGPRGASEEPETVRLQDTAGTHQPQLLLGWSHKPKQGKTRAPPNPVVGTVARAPELGPLAPLPQCPSPPVAEQE
jgi:hypothetical protein